MADFNGVNTTLAADPTGANIIAPGQWGGRVRVRYDYIVSATGHRNKTIKVGEVKVGETFLGGIITCESAWGGSVTGTVKVGTTTVSAALDLNTGIAATVIPSLIAGVGAQGPVTTAADITVTISDHAVTADKTLRFATIYATD